MVSTMTVDFHGAPAFAPAPDEMNRRVAENVAQLMWRAGLIQARLADLAGITAVTLGRKLKMRNDWTVAEVGRLAEVLGVTPAELVSEIPSYEEWRARRDSNPKPSVLEPRPVFTVLEGGREGVKPRLTPNRRPLLVLGDELQAVI